VAIPFASRTFRIWSLAALDSCAVTNCSRSSHSCVVVPRSDTRSLGTTKVTALDLTERTSPDNRDSILLDFAVPRAHNPPESPLRRAIPIIRNATPPEAKGCWFLSEPNWQSKQAYGTSNAIHGFP
jgi:hypothetical protein